MRCCCSYIRSNHTRGASAVYVLCLFPVLIAVTFVAIDVARWNFLRDALIQEAATIAKLSADIPIVLGPEYTPIDDTKRQELERSLNEEPKNEIPPLSLELLEFGSS